MPGHGAGARLRRLLAKAAVVAGLAGAAVAWACPASAHTELVASSPAAGDRVPLATDRVVLDFGEDLVAAADDITVRGPDGADAVVGEPGVLGSRIEAPLHLAVPGRYTVAYRVMGQDGHLVTGTLSFTATAVGLPLPDAVAAPDERLPGAAPAAAPGSTPTGVAGPVLRWVLPGTGLVALLLVLHSAERAARRRERAS